MRGVRIVALALTLVLSACSSPGKPHASHHPSASTTSVPGTATTAVASGVRTVLSPVGLNVRAQPSKTAAIVQTAAQGAVLTVLAQTDQSGGWFQIRGPTVTGWISNDPALSAPGKFTSYSSTQHQVSLLYPESWTVAESPPTSVVFHLPSGSSTVVVTTAATVDQLVRGRVGYQRANSKQVVVCGVTGTLATYSEVGAASSTSQPAGVVDERYLAQVHLTLDAQHALGLDAHLGDQSQLEMFRSVVNSVTFPFPQCGP